MNRLLANPVLLAISLLALALSVVALVLTVASRPPRIGIVRIQKVLERYDGALDAKKAFRTTTMAWGANVDTLRSELQRLVFEYESVGSSNPRLRDSLGLQLRRKEAQIADYSKAVEQKTAQEQQLLTEGVISQVRTAAESVAKSEGVDCFLAVQDDGMLVFALETVDMTDVVLERLRTTYRGQFKSGAAAKQDAGPKP